MTRKVYNILFALTLLLFTANLSYGLQTEPLPPLPPMKMTDTLSRTDLSKMKLKFEKLRKQDWQKQTFAMQESFKKMGKSMEEMGERMNKEFKGNFQNFNSNTTFQNGDNNNAQDKYDFVKVKNYSKSYSADDNDRLSLSNLYGRITVNTWAKNEVKVDVQVKAQANDEAIAQNGIDMVNIDDSKDGNAISFKTNITQNSKWNHGNHHSIDINYTVYMPAKLQLSISNNYGSVILPDLSGEVKLAVAYTNVTAQRISNPASVISGSYGNVKVVNFGGSKISFAYGDVNLGDVSNLRGSISYGNVSLGKLRGDVALSLAYLGGIKIGEIDDDLKSLKINSAYSSVVLSPTPRSNFNFNVSVSYNDFDFDNNRVNITRRTPEPGSRGFSPTKTYQGTYGKGNADAQVQISSAYGSVKFN
ncbi:hypothetical protein GCM10027037_29820 [Mucilaginibacter koreensis]